MLKITKICIQKFLIFVKILKMRKTDIIYFFNLLIILYCTKRRCVQLEVERIWSNSKI